MTKLRNYLGQLRLYSLVDLILMVLAFGFGIKQTLGAAFLWIFFLALLEEQHKHPNRLQLRFGVASAFMVAGVGYLRDDTKVAMFLGFSLLYCFKNRRGWAMVSPLFRGCQTASLLWGHASSVALVLASGAVAVRNILGDARDTTKDRRENMLTWPVLLNLGDHKYLHLLAVMATSALWCWIGNFHPAWLAGAWILQITTYWLTPR